jgi:hypothetical protein
MTFDRMHFDLKRGLFASGQAYVAISRMRSLEGLTLSNPLMRQHVILDPEIKAFANSYNDTALIDDEMEIGERVYSCLKGKDYDGAARTCLTYVVEKCRRGDYRNAALLAKKMFDVMLDDECLMGETEEAELLKDSNMTCDFLNAVLCLYGRRYEEAIGFADLVLGRRTCLEAMFVKERALYALDRYEDAYDMDMQIIMAANDSDDRKGIDKKQLLLEAKINMQIGNPNMAICKKLIKICPECLRAYVILKEESLKNGKALETTDDGDNDENERLVTAFNDRGLNDKEFVRLLEEGMGSKAFTRLGRRIGRLS